MHQPYYVDSSTQTAVMPWVRLHTVKGYWDMICLMEDYPHMRASFNLTPVLVKQIEELASGIVRDEWWEWTRVPAAELTEMQRVHLLEHFFKINWDNLIRPHPRYWQLLHKRGMDLRHVDLKKTAKQWSEAEFRDLQVWFNLAWCGYKATSHFPELKELKTKGQGFSETDKQAVVRVHREILQRVLPKYRELAERGQVELTTSPFFHPILPLVFDTDFAKRCMPHTALPPRFSQPEDAREQLRLAVEQHARLFGSNPRGLWPSEGSVCPEMIPLLHDMGIEWFGTDEEILFRSLANENMSLQKGRERLPLYHGYEIEYEGARVSAAFRDRSLSDFIGFSASKNTPVRAAEFLVGHLRQIAEVADKEHGLAPIILDGENAWEYFPDGGEMFLRELYGTLCSDKHLAPLTFGDYFRAHKPAARISKLHTGSWIRADFDIWIGDPEENRAWELLGQARRYLEGQGSTQSEEARRKALWEIYAAEGSDWFWWYGPDFQTDSDSMFDHLFRRHLENVYLALGTKPPEVLKKRIRQAGIRLHYTHPKGLFQPALDGRVTSFFEWYEAGVYEVGKNLTTMYRGDRTLRAIYFGFNLSHLHLRLDFEPKANRADVRFRIHVVGSQYHLIEIEPATASAKVSVSRSSDGGLHFDHAAEAVQFSVGDIIELSFPAEQLGLQPGAHFGFFVQEHRAGVEVASHPENGVIRVEFPRPDFELENWQV
jgi:alpha-amylase/alpha-mannosidase (GH57 family)